MRPVLKFTSSHDIIALKSPLHFVTLGLETHKKNTLQASSKEDTSLLKSWSTPDVLTKHVSEFMKQTNTTH